jgi:hypothetical protein
MKVPLIVSAQYEWTVLRPLPNVARHCLWALVSESAKGNRLHLNKMCEGR